MKSLIRCVVFVLVLFVCSFVKAEDQLGDVLKGYFKAVEKLVASEPTMEEHAESWAIWSDILLKAAADNPESPARVTALREALGMLNSLGEFERSDAVVAELLSITKDSKQMQGELLVQRGEIAGLRGRKEDAINYLESAFDELDIASDPRTFLSGSLKLMELTNSGRSNSVLQKCLDFLGKHPEVESEVSQYMIGTEGLLITRLRKRKKDKSYDYKHDLEELWAFGKENELQQRFEFGLINLGRNLSGVEKKDLFERWVDRVPYALYELAVVEFHQGNFKEARMHFERIVDEHAEYFIAESAENLQLQEGGTWASILFSLVKCCRELGDEAGANKYCKLSMATFPKDARGFLCGAHAKNPTQAISKRPNSKRPNSRRYWIFSLISVGIILVFLRFIRRPTINAAVLLVLVLGGNSFGQEALKIDELINLGEVGSGESAFKISVENSSKGIAGIERIDLSCGCLSLKNKEFPIKIMPSKTLSLEFAINTSRRRPGRINEKLLLTTLGGLKKVVTVRAEFATKNLVVPSDHAIYLTSNRPGKAKHHVDFELLNYEEEFENQMTFSGPSWMSIDPQPLVIASSGKDKTKRVNFVADVPSFSGLILGSLEFKGSNEKKLASVAVVIRCSGALRASAKTVVFTEPGTKKLEILLKENWWLLPEFAAMRAKKNEGGVQIEKVELEKISDKMLSLENDSNQISLTYTATDKGVVNGSLLITASWGDCSSKLRVPVVLMNM